MAASGEALTTTPTTTAPTTDSNATRGPPATPNTSNTPNTPLSTMQLLRTLNPAAEGKVSDLVSPKNSTSDAASPSAPSEPLWVDEDPVAEERRMLALEQQLVEDSAPPQPVLSTEDPSPDSRPTQQGEGDEAAAVVESGARLDSIKGGAVRVLADAPRD